MQIVGAMQSVGAKQGVGDMQMVITIKVRSMKNVISGNNHEVDIWDVNGKKRLRHWCKHSDGRNVGNCTDDYKDWLKAYPECSYRHYILSSLSNIL